MNDSRLARQIIDELPRLVSEKVIDDATVGALRRHYGPRIRAARSVSMGLVITAILGGLLVGSGIILLLAHNWDDLSKPARAFVSVLPLLASIGLSGHAILRRMDSAAWREGCGVFWFLSIGASIALVSQTYHLYNDMAGFLACWILLALPVVYLLDSGAAFAGCLACVVAYSFEKNGYWWIAPFSAKPFALLALGMPYYAWHVWRHRDSLRVTWMSWALAIALPLTMPALVKRADAVFVLAAYGLLAVLYYLAGQRWFGAFRGIRNPFRTLGSLGMAIVAVALTYKWVYGHGSWNDGLPPVAAGYFGVAAVIAWLATGFDLLRCRMDFNVAAALLPVLFTIGIFSRGNDATLLLMNVSVLALGVFTLARGVRRDSLLSMNEGMALIAALIVCRFFDSDYGFVARGVAFILTGCGFLAANLVVMSRRRREQGGES